VTTWTLTLSTDDDDEEPMAWVKDAGRARLWALLGDLRARAASRVCNRAAPSSVDTTRLAPSASGSVYPDTLEGNYALGLAQFNQKPKKNLRFLITSNLAAYA